MQKVDELVATASDRFRTVLEEILDTQQILRRTMEEHQARLTEMVKAYEELTQHIGSLERFNDLLKSKTNEMKEQYESTIIENVDLRDVNTGLKDTVRTLQNTPAFNIIADTASSSHAHGGTPSGPVPFGKTVVETNRGLTVTIESSHDSSPEKASLHHGWIPQILNGAAIPFPDIAPQHQSTSLTRANEGSTQIAIHTPGRSKGRAIMKGTKEVNESFERIMRTLPSSPLANSMNIINVNNNAAAAAASSSFVSNLSMPVIEPTGVYPVTPSKVKSKLNPTVEAFTLYDNNFKSSVTAMNTQKEESIPPHLRHLSKVSSEEDPVITTEEQSVKDKIKDQDPFAASAEKESAKENEPLQATSLTPRILPHLRRPITVITNEDIHPSQAQRSGNDKLFEINPSGSPKAGEKKTVPLPPGFIPISTKDAIVNTETAAPNKTREAASLTAAHDLITYRNPTAKGEEAAPGREISVKPTSEKEISAAFVAEYGKRISSLSEKYGRESSDAAKVDWSYAVKYEGAAPEYLPPRPIGTHKLGALLDDECAKLVLKPGKGSKVDEAALEWKAVRKDGKVVYVL